jgi:hypothetical protein
MSVNVVSQTSKYLNLELLGVYNLAGVSFDSKFAVDSHFGYKIGVGYGFEKSTYSDGSSIAFGSESAKFRTSPVGFLRKLTLKNVVSVPINAYYLFGKSNHHFETGLGLCPYYATFTYDNYDGFRYYCFARLGYRFENFSKPFNISAGIDIPFKTWNSDFEQAIGLYPSVSIGYKL